MTPPTEDEVRMALMVLGNALGSEAQHLSIASAIATIETALDEARKDRERLDWYEQQHKLHGAVEVLYVYVVDEYELTITHDGNPVRYVRAPTLRAAIDQARGA